MTTTLALVLAILALLAILEVLNAVYDSVVEGLRTDLARREPTPIWLAPMALTRWLLVILAGLAGTVSLWFHEAAHALAQFAFGGRPRIALLRNGGYAQARPWASATPARLLYSLGGGLGLGVMCLAPILLAAAVLAVALAALTPLHLRDLFSLGRALSVHLDVDQARSVGLVGWHAMTQAHWWAWPVAVGLGLLLAPAMTPSSVDYVHGFAHLLGYALAAIIAAAVLEHAPRAMLPVAIVAGVVGVAATLFGPRSLRNLGGGLGLSLAVLGLALVVIARKTPHDPMTALQTGLGTVLVGLGLAAVVLVAFVAGFLVLSLLALRPRTLWYTAKVLPRHLRDVVRRFHTCETCKVHYHGSCDGCGRTPDGPAPPPTTTPPVKRGLIGLLGGR